MAQVNSWSNNGVELSLTTQPLGANKVYLISERLSESTRALENVPVAEVRLLPNKTKTIHVINDPDAQKLALQFHRYGPRPEVGATSSPKCPYQAGENRPRFVSLFGASNLLTTYEGESQKYRDKLIQLLSKRTQVIPQKCGIYTLSWIKDQQMKGSQNLFNVVHHLVGKCLIKALLDYEECSDQEIALNTTFFKNLFKVNPVSINDTSSKSFFSQATEFAQGTYTYFWTGSQWTALAKTIIDNTAHKPGSFCHSMREEGLSDIEIAENVRGVLLAGQETVGYLLGFLLYEYARAPQMQKAHRLALESDLEMGRALLKQSLLEAMRLYPVGGCMREAGHDQVLTLPSKTAPGTTHTQYIKQGDMISIYPYTTNRNRALFGENTHKFDPTRKGLDQVKSTLFPFGSGPHRCPGEKIAEIEILFFLEQILRNSQFSTHTAIEDTVEGFTLRPINDIAVTFSPINSGY